LFFGEFGVYLAFSEALSPFTQHIVTLGSKLNMEPSDLKSENVKSFFKQSDSLAYLVTRQLSHIKCNWELIWDSEKQEYLPEEDSYAELLNQLINDLNAVSPPSRYHENEDCLAEYVISNLKWNIKKVGGRWVGQDYAAILEQGGFNDINQENLILAAAGRIKSAINREQFNFDEMELSHQKILGNVLACILYHRTI
jgi:hypothetical protein